MKKEDQRPTTAELNLLALARDLRDDSQAIALDMHRYLVKLDSIFRSGLNLDPESRHEAWNAVHSVYLECAKIEQQLKQLARVAK